MGAGACVCTCMCKRTRKHMCIIWWSQFLISHQMGEVWFQGWNSGHQGCQQGRLPLSHPNTSRINPWRPSSMCYSICPPTKKCLQYIQCKISIWVYEGYIESFKRFWNLSSAQTKCHCSQSRSTRRAKGFPAASAGPGCVVGWRQFCWGVVALQEARLSHICSLSLPRECWAYPARNQLLLKSTN